jgi:aryl-alcohol dehydrogenase-like predicted oxidoreductase
LDHSLEEVERAANAIQELTGKERNAAHIAIRFVLSAPAVASAVLGVRTSKQLEETIQAAGLPPLNVQEIQTLTEAIKSSIYAQHR